MNTTPQSMRDEESPEFIAAYMQACAALADPAHQGGMAMPEGRLNDRARAEFSTRRLIAAAIRGRDKGATS